MIPFSELTDTSFLVPWPHANFNRRSWRLWRLQVAVPPTEPSSRDMKKSFLWSASEARERASRSSGTLTAFGLSWKKAQWAPWSKTKSSHGVTDKVRSKGLWLSEAWESSDTDLAWIAVFCHFIKYMQFVDVQLWCCCTISHPYFSPIGPPLTRYNLGGWLLSTQQWHWWYQHGVAICVMYLYTQAQSCLMDQQWNDMAVLLPYVFTYFFQITFVRSGSTDIQCSMSLIICIAVDILQSTNVPKMVTWLYNFRYGVPNKVTIQYTHMQHWLGIILGKDLWIMHIVSCSLVYFPVLQLEAERRP